MPHLLGFWWQHLNANRLYHRWFVRSITVAVDECLHLLVEHGKIKIYKTQTIAHYCTNSHVWFHPNVLAVCHQSVRPVERLAGTCVAPLLQVFHGRHCELPSERFLTAKADRHQLLRQQELEWRSTKPTELLSVFYPMQHWRVGCQGCIAWAVVQWTEMMDVWGLWCLTVKRKDNNRHCRHGQHEYFP